MWIFMEAFHTKKVQVNLPEPGSGIRKFGWISGVKEPETHLNCSSGSKFLPERSQVCLLENSFVLYSAVKRQKIFK